MKRKIVLIDPFPEEFVASLKALNADILFIPDCNQEQAIASLKDSHVLIMNSKISVNSDSLLNAQNLKLICRAGVGLDHMDLPLLKEKGIEVFCTPGANAISVAEQALGMLISLMHNIAKADREIRNGEWKREENRATELFGKTIGIIGYGNTGSEMAKRVAAMGMNVLAYDKYKAGFGSEYIEEADMHRIFQEAQVLSLHIPLSSDTQHLVQGDYLSRFRKLDFLLNLSRGEILKTEDVILFLKDRKLKGLGLDVFENEKIGLLTPKQQSEFDFLRNHNQVILCPHIGGWSHESLQRINSRILERVKIFLAENE